MVVARQYVKNGLNRGLEKKMHFRRERRLSLNLYCCTGTYLLYGSSLGTGAYPENEFGEGLVLPNFNFGGFHG